MTPDDQIKAIRYYWHDTVAVAVFEHGTAVVCRDLDDAVPVMKAYAVPGDGESHCSGDIQPLSMDNGSTLIVFTAPSEWCGDTVPYGQAVRVASDVNMRHLAKQAKPSTTEVFQTEGGDPQERRRTLHACLGAPTLRGRDAREPVIVASWAPEKTT